LSPYYYTTAALPTIRLGEKILIKEEQFLEFAEDTLKAGDYQILLKSRLGSTEPTGFVFADRILSWEAELRLELAKARLAKLKHDPPPCLPESNGRDVLVEKARTAVAMDSPLEAECFLNQLRWSFIEEMAVSHFFDLEALVVYYFKLQIALRQEKFQKEPGQEAFEKTYDAVTESFTINTL
jgi:hypothetical protein